MIGDVGRRLTIGEPSQMAGGESEESVHDEGIGACDPKESAVLDDQSSSNTHRRATSNGGDHDVRWDLVGPDDKL